MICEFIKDTGHALLIINPSPIAKLNGAWKTRKPISAIAQVSITFIKIIYKSPFFKKLLEKLNNSNCRPPSNINKERHIDVVW